MAFRKIRIKIESIIFEQQLKIVKIDSLCVYT